MLPIIVRLDIRSHKHTLIHTYIHRCTCTHTYTNTQKHSQKHTHTKHIIIQTQKHVRQKFIESYIVHMHTYVAT